MSLIRLFQKLESSETKDVFNALSIGNKVGHRLAKTHEGYPILMICTKRSFENKQRFSLQNLKIQQDIECSINDKGKKRTDFFTLIIFTNTSNDLHLYFLRIAEPLLELLSPQPTEKEVTNVVFKFIEIFKALIEPAKKSVLGLWAELLVIAESETPDILLSAWHDSPYEKYDFGMDNWRIEVKATIQDQRVHSFSFEQLNPPNGVSVNIASILTKNTVSGKTIHDLYEIIKTKINNLELISKMNLVIAQTLGETIEQSQKIKFDYLLACQTLQLYSSNDIPKISTQQVPAQVFDIKFKVDMTGLDNVYNPT